MEIGRRKMRGVTSEGMLCSGKELGLSDDGAGLLVLGGRRWRDAPGRAPRSPKPSESSADVVLDIAVEANRPDALCMAGIARDLAARLGLDFTTPGSTRTSRGQPARARRCQWHPSRSPTRISARALRRGS